MHLSPAPIVASPVPRIIAFDVGEVRIGVALTDPLGYTALRSLC